MSDVYLCLRISDLDKPGVRSLLKKHSLEGIPCGDGTTEFETEGSVGNIGIEDKLELLKIPYDESADDGVDSDYASRRMVRFNDRGEKQVRQYSEKENASELLALVDLVHVQGKAAACEKLEEVAKRLPPMTELGRVPEEGLKTTVEQLANALENVLTNESSLNEQTIQSRRALIESARRQIHPGDHSHQSSHHTRAPGLPEPLTAAYVGFGARDALANLEKSQRQDLVDECCGEDSVIDAVLTYSGMLDELFVETGSAIDCVFAYEIAEPWGARVIELMVNDQDSLDAQYAVAREIFAQHT